MMIFLELNFLEHIHITLIAAIISLQLHQFYLELSNYTTQLTIIDYRVCHYSAVHY